jgi:cell division control protein 45
MIIKLEKAANFYSDFVNRLKRSNGKVIIFVGFDIDSLCSLRILVNLLRTDNIPYDIIPVMSHTHIDTKLDELKKIYEESLQKEIKAFVMINCGGTRDMTKKWFCEESYGITCLLIDVQRPSHHNNINLDSIIIIDDNFYDIENCPREEDMNEMQNIQESDEDELMNEENEYSDKAEESQEQDEQDDDWENINETGEEGKDSSSNEIQININKNRKRIQKKKHNLDTIEEESQNDENNDENLEDVDKLLNNYSIKKSKKSAIEDEKKLKRKLRLKKLNRVRNYYGGNYFGYPAAYVLYQISKNRHIEDSQTLWLLIVAMTAHYLQYHLDESKYGSLYTECRSEVLRLNGNKKDSSSMSSNFERKMKKKAESEVDTNIPSPVPEEEKDRHDFSDVRVETCNKDPKTIIVDPDYRLILYRHWNLHDSIVYSNYTLGHLMTWIEQGKQEIKKILTLVGVPVEEAKQKYYYMKNQYKTNFKEKILEVIRKFDLKDFLFDSFSYQLDQKTQLSASDFVHCLSALLEYPYSLKNLENEGLVDADEEYGKESDDQNQDDEEDLDDLPSAEIEMRQNNKFENFWACYDFLALKSSKLVRPVINLAIKFQQALVASGTQIIDKRAIQSSRTFRYATISSDITDAKYFHNPIALEKLALFIMDTYHTARLNNKKNGFKPFVLAFFNSVNKSYLVAGTLGSTREENDKSQFPMRFRVSANHIGANLILNNFDDSIVEVPQDEYYAFLEKITNN